MWRALPVAPWRYLQPDLRRKNPCSSAVALLGPTTNPGSRASLGMLLVWNRDGGSTCDPAPAPWPDRWAHKSFCIPWESSCALKSFLHQLLKSVLWAWLPPQSSSSWTREKSKVPSEFLMAKMTLCKEADPNLLQLPLIYKPSPAHQHFIYLPKCQKYESHTLHTKNGPVHYYHFIYLTNTVFNQKELTATIVYCNHTTRQ